MANESLKEFTYEQILLKREPKFYAATAFYLDCLKAVVIETFYPDESKPTLRVTHSRPLEFRMRRNDLVRGVWEIARDLASRRHLE